MTRASIYVIVMTLLSLNLLLFSAGVRVVDNDVFVNRFIKTNNYLQNNSFELQNGLINTTPTNYDQNRGELSPGSNSGFNFIDVVGAIRNFLLFVVNIIFTPIGLFVGTGVPPLFTLLVGVPMLVAGIIALVSFVRGY